MITRLVYKPVLERVLKRVLELCCKPTGRRESPLSSGNECSHDLSTLIEPPDADGWQRESCGDCGQTLDWIQGG